MKKILFAILMGAATVSFVACSNGAYDANPSTNNSGSGNPLLTGGNNGGNGGVSILTSGSWKITAYTLTSGAGTTDLLALIDACERDDIFTFKTDNTIIRDEGASKCSASDPQTKNDGTWSINGSKFTGSGSAGSQTWDIKKLDNTTFEISATNILNGQTATATQTYTRP